MPPKPRTCSTFRGYAQSWLDITRRADGSACQDDCLYRLQREKVTYGDEHEYVMNMRRRTLLQGDLHRLPEFMLSLQV